MRTKIRMGALARRRLTLAAASTVLAFGSIVLVRAHAATAAEPPADPAGREPSPQPSRLELHTPELTGFFALTEAAVLADGTRELFGELRLEAATADGAGARRPVALVVVLDTSGSMIGDKITAARHAVVALADRMRDEDWLAIVTYDTDARIVQPLAPVRQVRGALPVRIGRVQAGGGTNIPAGLDSGTLALSDAPPSMVRRLVLVSDGVDGSGRPLSEVSYAVSRRADEGTTTSVLGVGVDYDEGWLTATADAGRGNYEFLAGGDALAGFFHRELEQASTTVAARAQVHLSLPDGWRIAQVYGATLDDETRSATTAVPLGSLFAGERRRVTFRFEVDAGGSGTVLQMGVGIRYQAARGGSGSPIDRNLQLGRLSVLSVPDEAAVANSRDTTLHAEAVAQQVDVIQAQAVQAWRDGRAEEAQRLTRGNVATLERWRRAAPAAAPMLDERIEAADQDRANFASHAPQSAGGRAYGLGSNAARRERLSAF